MNLGGIPVKIIDTAGIRDTGDKVEKIGVEKSKKCAENADIIFMMLDASRPLDEEDMEILDFIEDKKAIIIVNKTKQNSLLTTAYSLIGKKKNRQ